MPTESGPATADGGNPLRLSECPGCGYDLAGLPDAGFCPECGAAYDRDREVVLYGYGTGTKGEPVNESDPAFTRRMLFGMVAPVMVWLVYRHQPAVRWAWVAWLAMPVQMLAVRSMVWANRPPRGLVRVWLSFDAVRQDNLVPAAAAFGRRIGLVWLAVCVTGMGFIAWSERKSGGRAWEWTMVATVALIGATIMAYWWGGRAQPPKAGRWPWRPRPPASPWADPGNVQLGEEKPGLYRVRCPPAQPFVGRVYADAHLRLTPAEAAALRDRMAGWRRAAADRSGVLTGRGGTNGG